MNFSELMTQFYNEPFAVVPKRLFRDEKYKGLSSSAKLLYIFLFDRTRLSYENGWMDKYGEIFVFCKLDSACELLNCSRKTCLKFFKELENANLVSRKRQGFGQPNMIFVKEFSEI